MLRTPPRLFRIGVRFPRVTLIVVLALTLWAVHAARRLEIQNDLTSLLPHELESVRALDRLRDHFGGLGYLFVTVESNDSTTTERFADRLAARIAEHPSVLYVDHRKPIEFFKKRQWLYLDSEDLREVEHRLDRADRLKEKGVSPVFSHLMDFADPEDRPDLSFQDIFEKYEKKFGLSLKEIASEEDGRFLFFRVKLKENPQNFDATQRFMADMRKIEEETRETAGVSGVTVGYTGTYQKMLEQRDLTRGEILKVSAIVALLLFIILFVYFGRLNPTLLIAIPVTCGVLWTGGVVALTLGHLNVITSFAAAILAGLGSDYGIYLLSRFEEERRGGADFVTACERAFSNTGKATYLSMITTVAAFASLWFSDFKLFVEFGIVGAVGLALNYIAMMLLIPAGLAIEQRLGWRIFYRRGRWREILNRLIKPVTDRIPDLLISRGAGFLVLAVLVLIGASAFTLPKETQIHFDDGQIESYSLPSYQLADRISALSSYSMNPTVLIVKGEKEELRTVRSMETVLRRQPEGEPVFNRVLGLSSFVPDHQEAKKEILKRIRHKVVASKALLQNQRRGLEGSLTDSIAAGEITRDSLPELVRRLFLAQDGSGLVAVYLYPSFGRVTAESMKRYHDGIVALKKETGGTWEAADGTFISDDVIQEVERESPEGLLLVMAFLSTVAFLFVRPRKRALVTLGNLVGGMVLLSGVLWLLKIPLNIINIAVIPIILGTGLDCFIHMSERFSENRSVRTTLQTKVPAILVSNLTTMVGFGGLILTSSAGIRSAGWVAVLGVAVMTVLCVLVFSRWLILEEGRTASSLTDESTDGVVRAPVRP